jgi:hypothetical protein
MKGLRFFYIYIYLNKQEYFFLKKKEDEEVDRANKKKLLS